MEENILSAEKVLYSDRSIDWDWRKGERKLCRGGRLKVLVPIWCYCFKAHSKRIFPTGEEKIPPFPFFLSGFFLAGVTFAKSPSQQRHKLI